MIRIQNIQANDLASLLPLVEEYWRFEGIADFDAERISRQLERLIRDPHLGKGWIAFADESPVGYLLAVYIFSLEHMGLTAEIDEFFVLPESRGTGAGSKLLEAAESEFARIGCTCASLQLARGNDAARRFYYRRGYTQRSGYELLDKKLSGGRGSIAD